MQENYWQMRYRRWETSKNCSRWIRGRAGLVILAAALGMSGFCSRAAEVEDKVNESTVAQLLILFDKSGSMDDPIEGQDISGEGALSYGEMAVDWAQEICAFSVDREIELSIAFFDESYHSCGRLAEKVTKENCTEIAELFTNVEYGGNTNQKNALYEGSGQLETGSGGRKFIVILSDGDLDLDNNSQEDTELEIEDRKAFQSKCEELAGTGEYTIILIGLGKEVPLYEGIDMSSGNIRCYNDMNDFEEFRKQLLQDMGMDINQLSVKYNSFRLEDEYDKCIIRMEYDRENRESEGKNFVLYYESNEGGGSTILAGDDVYSIPLTTASYLYLDNPQKGIYQLDFSGTFRVDCIETIYIENVTLKLVDGQGMEYRGKEENGVVNYGVLEKIDDVSIVVGIGTKCPTGAMGKYYLIELRDGQGQDEDENTIFTELSSVC